MRSPADYFNQFSQIVGHDVTDPNAKLHLSWNDREQGRGELLRIRRMQKELKLLKQQVNATVSAIKSEFTTARTSVGKSIGAGLAAGFFGRRMVGRVNLARRDDLRRNQLATVAPYQRIKEAIDRTVANLDLVKGQIELSPEYQTPVTERTRSGVVPIPPAAALPSLRFFVYFSDEVKGPYTREQLAALRDAQAIFVDTLCCLEGTENWQRFDEIMF